MPESTDFELHILFSTAQIRHLFAVWLCNGGGEDIFAFLLEREGAPPVTFSYHDRGVFLADNTIRVKPAANV